MKQNASNNVFEAMKQYKSADNKRIVLRQALKRRPHDPQLREAVQLLTTPQQIRRSMRQGVFINYSRTDELFALQLREALRRVGVRVWLDLVDMDYRRDWHDEVRRALNNSGLMLAVMSPAALRNDDAALEREQFAMAGKLVLPVLSQHVDLSTLDFWLHPVDFTRGFENGLHQLRQLIQSPAVSA